MSAATKKLLKELAVGKAGRPTLSALKFGRAAAAAKRPMMVGFDFGGIAGVPHPFDTSSSHLGHPVTSAISPIPPILSQTCWSDPDLKTNFTESKEIPQLINDVNSKATVIGEFDSQPFKQVDYWSIYESRVNVLN
eukprot:TRINITY_DN111351_c0_g1_i1.p1 TRINITY_DN111351_c0_g1~~TRINITY_DN111351_c0_g1_i1.p1  ORF type:complete len:136 (+),score=31.53 TRINITY_DN111351_c0_g1_i1:94-501(+)